MASIIDILLEARVILDKGDENRLFWDAGGANVGLMNAVYARRFAWDAFAVYEDRLFLAVAVILSFWRCL